MLKLFNCLDELRHFITKFVWGIWLCFHWSSFTLSGLCWLRSWIRCRRFQELNSRCRRCLLFNFFYFNRYLNATIMCCLRPFLLLSIIYCSCFNIDDIWVWVFSGSYAGSCWSCTHIWIRYHRLASLMRYRLTWQLFIDLHHLSTPFVCLNVDPMWHFNTLIVQHIFLSCKLL